MDHATLERATALGIKIRELDNFIDNAKRKWEGRVVTQKQRFIFESIAYGALETTSCILDTKLKNKVLAVLEEELAEMRKEFEAL